ncbi:MAG: ACT domain-containing protein [Acidimicrobiia bacterium]
MATRKAARKSKPVQTSQPITESREFREPGEVRRTEIVIEVPDRPGVLASIGEILGDAKVNIVAAAAFTAKGTGILHLVVDESQDALAALKKKKIPVAKVREVYAVSIEDRPGELGRFARRLADRGSNISALYLAGERFGDKELIVAIEEIEEPPKSPGKSPLKNSGKRR